MLPSIKLVPASKRSRAFSDSGARVQERVGDTTCVNKVPRGCFSALTEHEYGLNL